MLENLNNTSDSQTLWRTLKSLDSGRKQHVPVNVDELKQSFTDNESKYQCEYFDDTFLEEAKVFMTTYDERTNLPSETVKDVTDAVFTEDEISAVLKRLKPNKSCGLDGIPTDFYRVNYDVLSYPITQLFNYILHMADYPEQWAEGMITPIHKDKDKTKADNYRRITISPALGKILDMAIAKRLIFLSQATESQDDFNGGFKEESMTADNLFILNSCIEKAKALNQHLYICFVDFRKAFNSVNRTLMFYKLIKSGINGKIIKLLHNMYSKTKSRICLNGILTEFLKDTIGVNQGGSSSPHTFVSYLSDLRQYLDESAGIHIDSDLILLHLLWADDLILVSSSQEGLQQQLDLLFEYCSKWRLIINTLKTKVMCFPSSINVHFKFNGSEIETVKSYKYLGCVISNHGNLFNEHVKYALEKAHRAEYKIYSYCYKLGQIPPLLACKLFDSLVSPIIGYCGEIWYNNTHKDTIEKYHLKFLKKILKVKPATTNAAVYGELGRYPLHSHLQTKVFSYWHRISNLPHTHIVYKIYKLLCELHECGFKTWVAVIETIASKAGISLPDSTKLRKQTFKKMVKSTLQKQFADEWATSLLNYPKLECYRLFKINFSSESYLLNIMPSKYRSSLTKLRVSSHPLGIEKGRYTRPKTPRHQRICDRCDVNAIDDEFHFVINCTAFNNPRQELLLQACLSIPNFLTLHDHEQFNNIMSTKDKKLQIALGKFCKIAFKNMQENQNV